MIIGLASLGLIVNFFLLIFSRTKDLEWYHDFSLMIICWSMFFYAIMIIFTL